MFYMFGDEVESIEIEEINKNLLCAGIVTVGELEKLSAVFSLPKNVDAFINKGKSRRVAVKYLGDDFTFVRFDVLERNEQGELAFIVKKNLLICINLNNLSFIQNCFFELCSRSICENAECEKLICTLLEIICESISCSFDEENEIGELEKEIIEKNIKNDFNKALIEKKQELLQLRSFYEQLIDICEIFIENENEIFTGVHRFKIFRDKAIRFKENTDIMRESVTHLWDAYQAYVDVSQNEIMKIFTVVTSIFLPMTVIVGWYGMNFSYMPELKSRFGYIYVILLNICVVSVLVFLFKKKKWI